MNISGLCSRSSPIFCNSTAVNQLNARHTAALQISSKNSIGKFAQILVTDDVIREFSSFILQGQRGTHNAVEYLSLKFGTFYDNNQIFFETPTRLARNDCRILH